MNSTISKKTPYVGSFVLETLTTGMYGESRNALREYVQNAADAIRAAVATGVLRERAGRVEVWVQEDKIVIRDNGIGINASSAWATLTAIGASKKDRIHDAGFRGIGRLAGIAFCDLLSFKTKAAGEETETTVVFNCRKLREGMAPESGGSQQLVELLQSAVSSSINDDANAEEHYTEVTLDGLSRAPEELKDLEQIKEYLAATSPLPFNPKWTRGQAINTHATEIGRPLDAIRLFVGTSASGVREIRKLYRDSYPAKNEVLQLDAVQFFRGNNDHWWAWVGLPTKAQAITDSSVNGLRIRVRNIQVGGPELLDAVFARKGQSYARFNKYYVGEIHIDPTALVPNARRDGFEDDAAWSSMREELDTKICRPLSSRAHKLSAARQKSIEVLERKFGVVQEEFSAIEPGDSTKNDDRTHLLSKVLRLRTQLAGALKQEEGTDIRIQLRSQMDAVDQMRVRLSKAPSQRDTKALRAEIRSELVTQVLQIIQPHLDPDAFARVKAHLQQMK